MTAGTLLTALDEIIEGKTVERSVHSLEHDGTRVTPLFIDRLIAHGFTPTKVAEVELSWGERVPAFVIRGDTAYFGWVFVEKFTETKSRKLFGSLVKNVKGDWAIQIAGNNPELIYANPRSRSEMENDYGFVME